MKKIVFLFSLVAAFVFTTDAQAQKFSGLDKSPMDGASYPSSYKVSDKMVKLTYSRPQLKGRSLDKLAPAGKVWRTGANESVEITFYKDATFGGKSVKAGTYALFTIPGSNEWKVILNKNLNQWGSYFYDESANVATVSGKVSEGSESLEAFSMVFEGEGNSATLHMGWGKTRVAVPVSF